MKIIVTWDKAYQPLADITNPLLKEYCVKHGYDLITNAGEQVSNRHPAWWKFRLAMKELRTTDWLCLADTDWVIMDHKVPLTTFTNDTEADLVSSYDIHGFMAGVIFLRNTSWSHHFLYTLWYEGLKFDSWTCREQTAIAMLLYREPKEKWHVHPQIAFNSYLYQHYPQHDYMAGNYKPGHFAIHIPGLPTQKRVDICKELVKKIEK
jgi:hypothetical protein